MPILNPDHLLEQAERLTASPPAGQPRQVDLRRAVSSSYYAVFHAVTTAAADEIVGVTRRASPQYALVYRMLDHRCLRDMCGHLSQPILPSQYAAFAPAGGFHPNVASFCIAARDLQERRHAADYDPSTRLRSSDVTLAVRTARSALSQLAKMPREQRATFVVLLLFPPKR